MRKEKKMQINKFLSDLELFYPYKGTEENKIKIFETYQENLEGICISNKCDYDWKKILMAIQRGYKKRDFPLLADIINFMPEGKKEEEYKPCKDEGSLIVVTLPNGTIYPFTVAGIGRNQETIFNEIKNKFGTCDIKTYPLNYQIIGTKVVEM